MAATKKAPAKKAKRRSRKAAPRKTKAKARTPLVLTKPESPSKELASTCLVVKGHEDTVAKLREQQKQLDELTAEIGEAKAALRKSVSKKRLQEEIKGNFHKTVELPSSDGESAKMVFQNRFNKIDVRHEEALRTGLNGSYDKLVSRQFDLRVKGDADLKKLKAALGDKFEALLAFVDVHEFLKVSGQFMETRAKLRPDLTDDENAACDEIAEQMQYDPQVRLK